MPPLLLLPRTALEHLYVASAVTQLIRHHQPPPLPVPPPRLQRVDNDQGHRCFCCCRSHPSITPAVPLQLPNRSPITNRHHWRCNPSACGESLTTQAAAASAVATMHTSQLLLQRLRSYPVDPPPVLPGQLRLQWQQEAMHVQVIYRSPRGLVKAEKQLTPRGRCLRPPTFLIPAMIPAAFIP